MGTEQIPYSGGCFPSSVHHFSSPSEPSPLTPSGTPSECHTPSGSTRSEVPTSTLHGLPKDFFQLPSKQLPGQLHFCSSVTSGQDGERAHFSAPGWPESAICHCSETPGHPQEASRREDSGGSKDIARHLNSKSIQVLPQLDMGNGTKLGAMSP